MSTQIKKDDVIKLILQFLKENAFFKTFVSLQEESNTYLNMPDSFETLKLDILHGRWDRVLKQTKHLKIKASLLMDLYELVICELLDLNETTVAQMIYQECAKLLYHEEKERCLRLDYLIKKDKIDPKELYRDAFTKEMRRQHFFQTLSEQLVQAPQSRLLTLLAEVVTNAHSSFVDIFTGQEDILHQTIPRISKIDKLIRYTEKTRVESAIFTDDSLITGSVDGIIEVWDPKLLKVRDDLLYQKNDQFMVHANPVIQLSSEQDLLVSADNKFVIKIWKISTGKLLKKEQRQDPVYSLLVHGDTVYVGTSDNIDVILLKGGKRIIKGGMVGTMQIIGGKMYAGSADGSVRIIDLQTGDQLLRMSTSDARVVEIKKVEENLLICSRSRDLFLVSKGLSIIQTYSMPISVESRYEFVSAACTSTYLYGVGSNSVLYCFQLNSGVLEKEFKISEDEVSLILHHPSNGLLFAFTNKGSLLFLK